MTRAYSPRTRGGDVVEVELDDCRTLASRSDSGDKGLGRGRALIYDDAFSGARRRPIGIRCPAGARTSTNKPENCSVAEMRRRRGPMREMAHRGSEALRRAFTARDRRGTLFGSWWEFWGVTTCVRKS